MEQTNEAMAKLRDRFEEEQKSKETRDIERVVKARLKLIAAVVRCETDRWARATDKHYKPACGPDVYLGHIDDCAEELTEVLEGISGE